MEKVVECINLEKKYFLFEKDYKIIPWLFTKKGCTKEITPLKKINLTINKGDVIGFVGKNGAGKSTLMKIIAGITVQTDGALNVNGKVNSLINLGAGFNQKLTGRQNIYYKGLLMGMKKPQIDSIIDDIIEFCEIGEFFELPLYMYSSGMSARLGFALAIFADHDILIVDEVFAVGDKAFREKSAAKMKDLFKSGKSIIFASHADEQIKQFCNRAVFIDENQIILDGTVDEVLNAYNKKYSPNKVVMKAKDFENKLDMTNRFMHILRTTVKVQKFEILREIAILHEYLDEYEDAYYYMSMASKLRPEGQFMKEKLMEFEAKRDKNILNFEDEFEKTVANIENFQKLVNNRNQNFGKAELYRELGIFYELQCDLKNAFKYMSYAKEIRPLGSVIVSKYDEYYAKLDKISK